MREFSDFERKIIDRIIELDDKLSLNVLGNILSGTFSKYGKYFIKIESASKCFVKIEENYLNSLEQSGNALQTIKEILEGTSRDIFVVVKLIEYLEKKDLIFLSGDDDVSSIGPEIQNTKYIPSSQFDQEISELLYKYSRKKFTPTEDLRRLRNNEYIGDEEVRHRKLVKQYNRTLIISVIAICAILIGVAASTFVPVSTNTIIGNFPVSMGITLKNDAIQNAVQSLEVIATEIKKTKTQNIQLTSTHVDRLVQLLQDNLNELRLIRTSINAVADNIESGKDRKNTQ